MLLIFVVLAWLSFGASGLVLAKTVGGSAALRALVTMTGSVALARAQVILL